MSILSGPAILQELDAGFIVCEPRPEKIGPNSIDLHLGDKLMMYASPEEPGFSYPPRPIDSKNPPPLVEVLKVEGRWLLQPGYVYLGATSERCGTTPESALVPHLDGRSSLARLGVWAHLAAGRGDVGFIGHWTVELVVAQPVIVYPGMRAFQMAFYRCEGPSFAYTGDYANRTEPVASRGIR